MPTQLWRTAGTNADDFIVLSDANGSITGGGGNDLIIGDGPTPFQFGTTNSLASPANIDSPVYWSTIENPLFGDATIPHTSLFVQADAGEFHYASVTVPAGETIVIDIDYGQYAPIGVNTDTLIRLLDSGGMALVTNDDTPYFTQEGAGSSAVYDSYLVYTNSSGTDQTYTIQFGYYGGSSSGNPFTGGQTFVANISVSGHAASAPAGNDDILSGGLGNDTIMGQIGDDRLYGREGNDQLFGGTGNDLIDGGDGFDTAWYSDAASGVVVDMRRVAPQNTGGAGVDTLTGVEGLVGSGYADTLFGNDDFNNIQAGAGNDLVLGNGGQDLLYGQDGSDTLIGGAGDDILRADESNYSAWWDNSLFGEAGNDTIYGWYGNDRLYGGDGDDTFQEGGGDDIIDGGDGIDTLQFNAGFGPLTVDLRIVGPQMTGQGTDTITAIENLQGTSQDDLFYGDGLANTLDGWWGNDTLYGNDGDDVLIGDLGDDLLDGGAGIDTASFAGSAMGVTVNLAIAMPQVTGIGTDTLLNIENLIGSGSNDTLLGTNARNVINGGYGNDLLRGQGGNDSLLGDAGDDMLLGGIGNDVLDGGDGSDTASYAGNSVGVTVDLSRSGPQNTGQGNDTLIDVENLIGTAFADTLTGNSSSNRLNGGAGADTMAGGAGSDTYIVDNAADVVVEAPGSGNDTVQSSIGYSLGANVERLTLTGNGNINGVGNTLNNNIIGNNGSNILAGGLGNDVLTGGGGADFFRFNIALNATTNVDRITDFDSGTDRIQLDDDVFTAIGAIGTLAAGSFVVGTSAGDANDRIIYDPATGNIYYDADGSGGGAMILFAKVDPMLMLSSNDFQIIG